MVKKSDFIIELILLLILFSFNSYKCYVLHELTDDNRPTGLPDQWIKVFNENTPSPRNYATNFNDNLYLALKRLQDEMLLN
ncbi:unnamed protein product [Brachionus calyciflorus]|uniref:Uncharacterized protein n=1 Tax=Brachionus calyciflorus TaxID=104777 RepID=A0A814A584_9BILA|nr:unnamed protein product [Brachionus calyciflorus]